MQQLGRACGNYLVKKAYTDKRIWVLDGDLADSDGAESFAEHHKERFIAAGIAEQNMVSVAAGLAAMGCRPWVFSFAAFLCYRAYDQIRTCISQANLPVTLVGSHAGACGGRNGKTHIALNDIGLIATLPNMNIWAPADVADTELAVESILADDKPAYLRCPRDPLPFLAGDSNIVRWIGEPSATAIISYGYSTQWAIEVQKSLASQNIQMGVLHFCKLWPLSLDILNEYLYRVKIAFVIEDHYAFGGFKDCLQHIGLDSRLVSCAWPSSWAGQSGSTEDLLTHYDLSKKHLVNKILTFMNAEENAYS